MTHFLLATALSLMPPELPPSNAMEAEADLRAPDPQVEEFEESLTLRLLGEVTAEAKTEWRGLSLEEDSWAHLPESEQRIPKGWLERPHVMEIEASPPYVIGYDAGMEMKIYPGVEAIDESLGSIPLYLEIPEMTPTELVFGAAFAEVERPNALYWSTPKDLSSNESLLAFPIAPFESQISDNEGLAVRNYVYLEKPSVRVSTSLRAPNLDSSRASVITFHQVGRLDLPIESEIQVPKGRFAVHSSLIPQMEVSDALIASMDGLDTRFDAEGELAGELSGEALRQFPVVEVENSSDVTLAMGVDEWDLGEVERYGVAKGTIKRYRSPLGQAQGFVETDLREVEGLERRNYVYLERAQGLKGAARPASLPVDVQETQAEGLDVNLVPGEGELIARERDHHGKEALSPRRTFYVWTDVESDAYIAQEGLDAVGAAGEGQYVPSYYLGGREVFWGELKESALPVLRDERVAVMELIGKRNAPSKTVFEAVQELPLVNADVPYGIETDQAMGCVYVADISNPSLAMAKKNEGWDLGYVVPPLRYVFYYRDSGRFLRLEEGHYHHGMRADLAFGRSSIPLPDMRDEGYESPLGLPGLAVANKAPEYPFRKLESVTPNLAMGKFPNTAVLMHPNRQLLVDLRSYQTIMNHFVAAALTTNARSRETMRFLTEMPRSEELQIEYTEEQFKSEVTVARRKDRKGYVFCVTLRPSDAFDLEPLQQHFVFVVDKSESIKKVRYNNFRKGVNQALDYLNENDTFNVVVIDSKLSPLSEFPLPWVSSTVREAKKFLKGHEFSPFKSHKTNLYEQLDELPQLFSKRAENTVVLLTDGASLHDIKQKKFTLGRLLQEEREDYTLHTACASMRNNASMLDLLSTFHRGEFVQSKTFASFPRKLARLVKHASHMVVKSPAVTAASEKVSDIELYPHSHAVPNIYSDRPFKIYGTIETLEDFDLVLQGKRNGHFVHMKFPVRLKEAGKPTSPIFKELATQQAYVCYENYLLEHDDYYLEEAERKLDKYNLSSPRHF